MLFIKELHLKNFRNYTQERISFSPGVCLIQGANGQGKSNLLEAIYNLCFARSFRNLKENDLVNWDAPYYYLQGTLKLQGHFVKVDLGYDSEKKRKMIKINGQPARQFRLADYCPVVFFIPEDLELIRRGPEERRRFLDRELSQEDALYADQLTRYNRVVYQKNKMLKEKKRFSEIQDLIRPWNKQLVFLGSRLIQKRAQVLTIWNRMAAENYNLLFQNDQRLKIVYNNIIGEKAPFAGIEEIEGCFAREIDLRGKEEWERGFSLLGPHRDDLVFLLGGRDARRFASHGQQRSVVIALKAAQIQRYSEKKEKPLFILDDVFSELDECRKKQCFLLFQKAEQVFLTVTEKENLPTAFLEQAALSSFLFIKQGKILELGHHNHEKNNTVS